VLWAGLIVASLSGATEPCTLSGDGDVDLCEKLYWRSRLASLAIPSYQLSTDGAHLHHGLSWTLAVDVPRGEWSEYFSLGVPARSGFPFQLGVGASLVWFLGLGAEGRIVLRTRIMSLVWPWSPASSFLHLTVCAGGSGGVFGFAPRIELRTRIGHIAWGGVVLAGGFQPYIYKNLYLGDVSVGLEAPWVWWW
jgi:hypothetical protein